jgi:hypothetical protein
MSEYTKTASTKITQEEISAASGTCVYQVGGVHTAI